MAASNPVVTEEGAAVPAVAPQETEEARSYREATAKYGAPPPRGDEWGNRARVQEFLGACRRERVILALDPGDRQDRPVYQDVWYNGWLWRVARGIPTSVPLPIAEIIEVMQQPYRCFQATVDRLYVTDIGDGLGAEIPDARRL